MTSAAASAQKPKALHKDSRVATFAPSSPASGERVAMGAKELERLGFSVVEQSAMQSEGYFAGSAVARRSEFLSVLQDPAIDALVATRGGYGAAYLVEPSLPESIGPLKPIVGFSDLTTLQIYLWQKHRWPTFYGPMLAAGLDGGSDSPNGYHSQSFRNSLMNSSSGWQATLDGEVLHEGTAEGIVLGGAMTLVEATLGTPWELDTSGAILLLEDRAMKPYQVDRVLLHLKHAGKFDCARAVILGDFPECAPPVAGSPSVRDIALRILGPLGIPIVFSAPIGHSNRPMLTLPLGVPARLIAEGSGTLQFPEPTVRP